MRLDYIQYCIWYFFWLLACSAIPNFLPAAMHNYCCEWEVGKTHQTSCIHAVLSSHSHPAHYKLWITVDACRILIQSSKTSHITSQQSMAAKTCFLHIVMPCHVCHVMLRHIVQWMDCTCGHLSVLYCTYICMCCYACAIFASAWLLKNACRARLCFRYLAGTR